MKRLGLILALLLLVPGCQKAAPAPEPEPEPPAPVYSEAPAESSAFLAVDGKALTVYGEGAVKLKDLTAALGEELPAGTLSEESTLLGAIDLKAPPVFDGTDWYLAAEPVLLSYGYHKLSEEDRTYFTSYPTADSIPAGVKIPVLMYHAVSDNCWGIESLFVSPGELEKQLQYLTEEGYTPIHFEDLGKADQIQKPILLTFDDGYDDNYTELFPLLQKYNAKATVFMIADLIGTEHYLTEAQLREMSESGLVSIQSHTESHEFLSTRTEDQLDTELYGSKLKLARITGKEPFVLCYPTGKYSALSLEKTAEYYEYGLLMSGPRYVTGSDPFKISRYYISRSTGLAAFKNMVK